MRKLIALIAALGIITVAAPANAAIYERMKWDDSFSDTFDDCGLEGLEYDWEGHGVAIIRTVAGTDEAYLGSNTFHYAETFTNPANGKSFTVTGNVRTRETSATHIEGNLWAFTNKDSGGSWVLRNSAGKILFHDAGTVEYTIVWDTLGDGQPSAEYVSDQLDAIHGHFNEVSFCDDLVLPLLA
ncbi:MAG: hypothetical protein ABIR39_03130 [Nocardioides sp.]|uniref:hypothetical protein n=1 Tax=Nocardioides sp. TaxID=35761 RepID=UPI003266186E